MNGYALVDSKQEGFSWHSTLEDAQTRQEWERRIFNLKFSIVKDIEAIWPGPNEGSIMKFHE